jgi:putative ABC transport system permease protein
VIRLETVRVSLRELRHAKVRTGLTTLGIVFGVAAVIAMVSIAEGARFEAQREVAALGTNAIRVRTLELEGNELSRARQLGVRGLVPEDVPPLLALPMVEAAAPLLVQDDVAVRRGERASDARVVGTTPAYPSVVSFGVAAGRFLGDVDGARRASVAVLGAKVAQDLLPFRSAVGERITLGGLSFTVIGVMEDRREASSRTSVLSAADLDRDVYVPAEAVLARFPSDPAEAVVDEVAVKVASGGDVRVAAALVRDALLRRHQGVRDVEVVVPEELLRQAQRSQRIFNVVMGAIASISLVVGGIGIMNVMLVTIIQRTQEIGIRRAVGATRHDIRDQFLLEALTIAVLGGLAGVVLGAGLAFGISAWAGWVTIVSLKAVGVAFVVAGATGVVFGLVPAVRASRVDPIECLRHE